ncbi:MAG: AraC family transcriptional regulator N-terminal domain-containing protein, partial [Verrucomicrobiae bacterium]|nr:AraC family transcriptional regulator N-terminal domain-containing protein [Verrucomicrobiae bacterium]
MRNSIAELAQKITRLVGNELELVTAVPNLTIYSIPAPTPPTGYLLEPSVCVILQGTKRVFLGEEDYSYAIKDFLVTSVDLPLSAEILKASSTEPYVGLTLKFDRKEVASILLDTHIPSRSAANNGPGIGIGTLSRPLFDAFRRLVELIEEPENVTTLSPLIQKEIIFR